MAGLDQEPFNARSKHETTLIGLVFPHVCVCVIRLAKFEKKI